MYVTELANNKIGFVSPKRRNKAYVVLPPKM